MHDETSVVLFCNFYPCSFCSCAKRDTASQSLTTPQVHVLFDHYTIAFSVRDINRALELLSENGVTTFGDSSGLDTAKVYAVELYAGYRQEYHDGLGPMIQLGVGAFLISKGRAVVWKTKRKKLKKINMDVQPLIEGEQETDVKFYDPHTGKLIFNGRLPEAIKNADLGIDYW